ncbi:hypothetical protein J4727_07465 [Providencia rettgeri]|uniref:Phosphate propanoyltransferase n=1 Tax=Providencia rettgeri TaxID=587 RepID=A0A939NGZ8_PRORE|nr:hypothetical protein [Providencia rettgeri]
MAIPVGISNCHVFIFHNRDVEALFGQDYQLTPFKDLNSPGNLRRKNASWWWGQKGSISKVRVLGPVRPKRN